MEYSTPAQASLEKEETHYTRRKKWINPFWGGGNKQEGQQLDRHKGSQLHTNSSLILQ